MADRKRAAIYGGTFDPVHNGHIEVARRVQELFELDEVIFVPACVPPHKRGFGISSAFHRVAMLALAIQDDEAFRISTIELDDPERPYAVDTVSRFQNELGSGHRLFFLIGADSWAEITTWHEWQRLLRMCDLIVVTRPGYDLRRHDQTGIASMVDVRGQTREEILMVVNQEVEPKVFLSDGARVDVSATGIRAAVRANDAAALQAMLPQPVAVYIAKQELFKSE